MSNTTVEALPADSPPVRWRKPLIGFGCVLAGCTALCSAATQYIAHRLNYHPALGESLLGHVYWPFDWITWNSAPWAGNVSTVFREVDGVLGVVAAGFSLTGFAAAARRRKPRRYNDIYGTARFANTEDMAESGFLDQQEGVYIGGWTDPKGILRYLRHYGAEHIAAFAPTRSGKGVGLVLPTLLSWMASCVIYDEKGELFQYTAGWRSQIADNVVFKWQPGSATDSCSYNFLDAVRLGTPYEVSDAQNIAVMLCDPDGKGIDTDHWKQTAYALITGLILHEMYKAKVKGKTASLPDVADALSDPSRPADKLYEEMVKNQHLGKGKPHNFVAQEGRAQLNRESKERTSVHSSAVTHMGLFRDPVVCENSRNSDFNISDLMNYERPAALYIITPNTDKIKLRPLVRLMLTTIVNSLTNVSIKYGPDGKPQMPHRHRMLLMLDEFASLGRLRVIESALATIAGFGLKAYLIMQDREQAIAAYGQNETILSNCHIQIAYAPNKYQTAQWISGILGKRTVNVEEISESGKRGSTLTQVTRSIRQVSQDLLSPEQVMSLQGPKKKGDVIIRAGEMLVWAAGMKARIRGTQILYFLDPVFSARAKMPPPPGKISLRNKTGKQFSA